MVRERKSDALERERERRKRREKERPERSEARETREKPKKKGIGKKHTGIDTHREREGNRRYRREGEPRQCRRHRRRRR